VWERHVVELNRLLTLLTGDQWQVACVPGGVRHDHGCQPAFSLWEAAEVALFSGGLDSTSYAADRMRDDAGSFLLIAYHEPNEAPRQQEIFAAVQKLGNRSVELRQLSQKVFGDGEKLELSSRSRGLLFVATGIYAASGHGVGSVIVPENGQLAINPPLTAARPASCSTRSVHPRTLESLNRLIASVGGEIEVINPFAELTKGDVCTRALRAGLSEDVLWRTVSCGHPPINRNGREFHCGRCFPCLVRRSGMLQAAGKDLTPYEYGLRALANGTPLPPDLLALWRWLGNPFSARDLIADLALPSDIRIPSVMSLLHRGRAELIEMIKQALPRDSVYLREWRPCA
jgi:7-cyano-7-deazaguanine synthase in queuosine biosynthesis